MSRTQQKYIIIGILLWQQVSVLLYTIRRPLIVPLTYECWSVDVAIVRHQ